MESINFLVVGVGGQGTLLASNVLAEVGVQVGCDVKKAEVHGMSQRGGSVNSHVRWANKVWSPVIGDGDVDVMLSLEKLETLRYLHMLRDNALVLVGEYKIPPLTVSSGNDRYPGDEEIERFFRQITDSFEFVPTLSLAEKAGNSRVHNVVMLGALSTKIKKVPSELWMEVIKSQVPPKHIESNQNGFLLGQRFGLGTYKD